MLVTHGHQTYVCLDNNNIFCDTQTGNLYMYVQIITYFTYLEHVVLELYRRAVLEGIANAPGLMLHLARCLMNGYTVYMYARENLTSPIHEPPSNLQRKLYESSYFWLSARRGPSPSQGAKNTTCADVPMLFDL